MNKAQEERDMKFINTIEDELKSKYFINFNNISFHRIASRPKENGSFEFGYGIDELLPIWVRNSPFLDLEFKQAHSTLMVASREMNKFRFDV